jgi:prevent-host-death family protein
MSLDFSHPITVTEAARRGVAGLIKDAEAEADVVVSRHGRPDAAVVSTRQLDDIHRMEHDLRDAALVLFRAATDTGVRTSLDDAIVAFGFDRAELESSLDSDLADGQQ